MPTTVTQIKSQLESVCAEVSKKIVGQKNVIRHAVAACIAGGHVLFEDVPGTGKTTLAQALARALGLDFGRIQGTPDLLPSDVVGTMVFRPSDAQFEFRKGPIFTELLLMDEINRATPRTQSALLEAMAEGQVTAEGQTYALAQPFFVVATANPIESLGVFPLPEAQLDRFLVQLRLGYTNEDEEIQMIQRVRLQETAVITPVLSPTEIVHLREQTRLVIVVDDVLRYIVQLCRATREHEQVLLGASPRAVLLLTAFSQALALFSGRDFVTPEDVQEAWNPVMGHRLRARVEWRTDGGMIDVADIMSDVLAKVTVPTEWEVGYA